MKQKLLLVLSLCLPASLTLADSRFGVGIDDDAGVKIKKNIGQHQIGVGANFRKSKYENDFSGDTNTDSYTLTALYRNYKPLKEKLDRFYEAEVTYVYAEVENSSSFFNEDSDDEQKTYVVGIYYGLEYYIAPEFSIEGKFGIQYGESSADNSDVTSFNAFSSGVAINYYW